MNRLKKAIADLRTYLGRDNQGIAKLDKINTLANEVRKELAKQKQIAEDSVEKMETLRLSQSKAQEQIQTLEEDNRHKAAIISQLERDVETWKKQSIPVEEVKKVSSAGLKNVFTQLRKEFRVAPRPYTIEDRVYVYRISDLINDYSVGNLLTLGRFIVVMARLGIAPKIVKNEVDPKLGDEGIGDKVVVWGRNLYDIRQDWERAIEKGGE